jgi:hypothetical protein
VYFQKISEGVAIAFDILRVPTMCQPTHGAQETDPRTLQPHTPTRSHTRSTHRIAKFFFQEVVVKPISSVYKKIARVVTTQEVMDDFLARIQHCPRVFANKLTCFFFPQFRHKFRYTIGRAAGIVHEPKYLVQFNTPVDQRH